MTQKKIPYVTCKSIVFKIPKEDVFDANISVAIDYNFEGDDAVSALIWAQSSYKDEAKEDRHYRSLIHKAERISISSKTEAAIISAVLSIPHVAIALADFSTDVLQVQRPEWCENEDIYEINDDLMGNMLALGVAAGKQDSLFNKAAEDASGDDITTGTVDPLTTEDFLSALPPDVGDIIKDALDTGKATLQVSGTFETNDGFALYEILSHYPLESTNIAFGIKALIEAMNEDEDTSDEDKAKPDVPRIEAAIKDILKSNPQLPLYYSLYNWSMTRPGEDVILFKLGSEDENGPFITPVMTINTADAPYFRVPVMETDGKDVIVHLSFGNTVENEALDYTAHLSSPDAPELRILVANGTVKVPETWKEDPWDSTHVSEAIRQLHESQSFRCAVRRFIGDEKCLNCASNKTIPFTPGC